MEVGAVVRRITGRGRGKMAGGWRGRGVVTKWPRSLKSGPHSAPESGRSLDQGQALGLVWKR